MQWVILKQIVWHLCLYFQKYFQKIFNMFLWVKTKGALSFIFRRFWHFNVIIYIINQWNHRRFFYFTIMSLFSLLQTWFHPKIIVRPRKIFTLLRKIWVFLGVHFWPFFLQDLNKNLKIDLQYFSSSYNKCQTIFFKLIHCRC